jgi:acetyl-CoA carboxylase carboxyltransferase component
MPGVVRDAAGAPALGLAGPGLGARDPATAQRSRGERPRPSTSGNGWGDDLADLARQRALAAAAGDPDLVARQHAEGRLTLAERLEGLVDRSSFTTLGPASDVPWGDLASTAKPPVLVGTARVAGRKVVVLGTDVTAPTPPDDVLGRAVESISELAPALAAPAVLLLDGVGEQQLGADDPPGRSPLPAGGPMGAAVSLRRQVPLVTLALGDVAGLGAAICASSHFAVMVRGRSRVLGGTWSAPAPAAGRGGLGPAAEADAALAAGLVDDAVDSEGDAFELVRQILAYLPPAAGRALEQWPLDNESARDPADLDHLLPVEPHQPYRVRELIECVVDGQSFLELRRGQGRSIVTALARVDGWTVAVIGGDPFQEAGALTHAAATKARRLVELAETFRLPVVQFLDQPGVATEPSAQAEGALPAVIELVEAIQRATVPWCSIVVRPRAAWPDSALVPSSAPVRLRYRWATAEWRTTWGHETGGLGEVIAPSETRDRLVTFLSLAEGSVAPERPPRGARPLAFP